ncbi:hypothetical protein K2173_012654 [Erythroxylum novogranatense]|uniref:EamA domain-containing protein n=1 Tax=Erythroxylum novogranatense TaxID=1862640 RepID=A0AAV8TTE7_9ROSI|nr:hypothetical protein K2173_012654 [Erythroxylum novogranatense]
MKFFWKGNLFTTRKLRSIGLLNLITILEASNIPVAKGVEDILDPAAFTVVRLLISAIVFLPFAYKAGEDAHTRNAGLELGFWLSLGYLMQAFGLLTSNAGRASFLSSFTIILVPLLEGILGTIVPLRTWIGAIMSITGVAMLISSGSSPCLGDFLNFFSAVFYGVHLLRTQHLLRNINKRNMLPFLGCEVCAIGLFSTIWYFAGSWFLGIQACNPFSWTWKIVYDWLIAFPWIPALFSGILSSGIGLWLEMDAMRYVPATEVAIIYGLEPVWCACFAWFFLGEQWNSLGMIGAALMLSGSLTVQIFGSSSSSDNRDDVSTSSVVI